MVFIDYRQTYDSVNRQALWKAMIKLFGNPQNMCESN